MLQQLLRRIDGLCMEWRDSPRICVVHGADDDCARLGWLLPAPNLADAIVVGGGYTASGAGATITNTGILSVNGATPINGASTTINVASGGIPVAIAGIEGYCRKRGAMQLHQGA